MKQYRGITYPRFFGWEWPGWALAAWRRFMCKRERHLWDEVLSGGDWQHYLHCDACQLMVNIESIDETYVKGGAN